MIALLTSFQIQYALQLIKPVIEGEAKSFEVRKEVCEEYNKRIQNKIPRSVWNFCSSYYRADGQRGANYVVWPSSMMYYWWLARWAQREEYVVVGGKKLERRLLRKTRNLAAVLTFVVALLAGLLWKADLLPLIVRSWVRSISRLVRA